MPRMSRWQDFLHERAEHKQLKKLLEEDDRYLF